MVPALMSDRGKSEPESQSTLERIMGERAAKAERLRAAGRHPYRNDVAAVGPTHTIAAVRAQYEPTRPPPVEPAPKGESDPRDATRGGGGALPAPPLGGGRERPPGINKPAKGEKSADDG